MGVFCDRLKLCSTAALDCRAGQIKARYHEKELFSYSSPASKEELYTVKLLTITHAQFHAPLHKQLITSQKI